MILEPIRLHGLAAIVTLAVLSFGCATAHLRLKTDDGEVFEVRPRAVLRVGLSAADYRAVMSSLDARWALPAPALQRTAPVQLASIGFSWRRSHSPAKPGAASGDQADLARGYHALCEQRGEAGDCLELFEDGLFFTATDKRTLATRVAFSAAFEAAAESLRGVTTREVEVAVLTALVVYMGLLALPEPVSKVIVIALAANLIASIGVDLFLSFIQGYRELTKEAEAAETFDDVRGAGERYGRRIGPSGARLMVVLISLGAGGALGAATGGGFSGAAQMTANAEAQGFALSGVGAFTSVQVAAAGSGVTFGVGAGMAVAPWVLREAGESAADEHPHGFRSYSAFKRAKGAAGPGKEWHHLVEQTDRNVARFGAEALHNTENIVAMDAKVHQQISALYSSIRFDLTGTELVVRVWLRNQSFAAQREFGVLAMKNVAKGAW